MAFIVKRKENTEHKKIIWQMCHADTVQYRVMAYGGG